MKVSLGASLAWWRDKAKRCDSNISASLPPLSAKSSNELIIQFDDWWSNQKANDIDPFLSNVSNTIRFRKQIYHICIQQIYILVVKSHELGSPQICKSAVLYNSNWSKLITHWQKLFCSREANQEFLWISILYIMKHYCIKYCDYCLCT